MSDLRNKYTAFLNTKTKNHILFFNLSLRGTFNASTTLSVSPSTDYVRILQGNTKLFC